MLKQLRSSKTLILAVVLGLFLDEILALVLNVEEKEVEKFSNPISVVLLVVIILGWLGFKLYKSRQNQTED